MTSSWACAAAVWAKCAQLPCFLGGLYLVARRVISPVIPLCYLGTVAVFALILGQDPLVHLLTGGLLLGAIFMATDYTTPPADLQGAHRLRHRLRHSDRAHPSVRRAARGVSFSIIIMNILVPHIERLTRPEPFGGRAPGVKRLTLKGVLIPTVCLLSSVWW